MELLYNNTYYKFTNALLEEDNEAKVNTSKVETLFKEYADSSTKDNTNLQKLAISLQQKLNVSTKKEDITKESDQNQITKYLEVCSNIAKSLSNIKI